jgi:hypothetical protein
MRASNNCCHKWKKEGKEEEDGTWSPHVIDRESGEHRGILGNIEMQL